MRQFRDVWRVLAWSGLVSLCASGHAGSLNEARSALEQWVQTRQLISRTQADWADDREILKQTLAQLERELAQVREQQAGVETNHTAVASQRAELQALKDRYQTATAAVRARVAELEARVRRLEPVLPPALRGTVQTLLNRLPTDATSTNAPLVPRVLTLITLLNEVDKFNAALTVAEETRPGPDGREIVVEVLYAGLGQAWFVSKSGDLAGVGVPESEGWQWTFRNELAPAITRALRMYRNELPAEFVSLPVLLR